MEILAILAMLILVIVVVLTTKPGDPRFNYRSHTHYQWCQILGTYANGVPKWRYSKSPTALALADIKDGPEGHKFNNSLFSSNRFNVKGLSGKQYLVTITEDGRGKKVGIKYERPHNNRSSSG